MDTSVVARAHTMAVVSDVLSSPPGPLLSDSESSTVSRERRRVALAAKAAVEQLSCALITRFSSLEEKLDKFLILFSQYVQVEPRFARLEVVRVCALTVDEVLTGLFDAEKPPCSSLRSRFHQNAHNDCVRRHCLRYLLFQEGMLARCMTCSTSRIMWMWLCRQASGSRCRMHS